MTTSDIFGIILFLIILFLVIFVISYLLYKGPTAPVNLCHSNSDCGANQFCRGDNQCYPTNGLPSGSACTTNGNCQLNLICVSNVCGILSLDLSKQ